jgi:micrococcal nuclease
VGQALEGAGDRVDPGADQAASTWVVPIDGECPEGYPVKANVKSGIYHVPGGRFYARGNPDRCYVSAAAAEADGYRAAKS